MKHILLTGATGTLGRQVVRALANEPDITLRLMRHRVLLASFPQSNRTLISPTNPQV